jgi:hypothetical protein
MSREYQPSSGVHKRGPTSGHKNNPDDALKAPRCRCGVRAIPVDGECLKCGKQVGE